MNKTRTLNKKISRKLQLYKNFTFGFGIIVVLIISLINKISSDANKIILVVLIIISIIGGFLNIYNENSISFLIGIIGIVLLDQFLVMISSSIITSEIYGKLLISLNALFAPAGIIIAFKEIFKISKVE